MSCTGAKTEANAMTPGTHCDQKGTAGGTRTRNLRFGGPVRYPLRHDSGGTSAPPEGYGTSLGCVIAADLSKYAPCAIQSPWLLFGHVPRPSARACHTRGCMALAGCLDPSGKIPRNAGMTHVTWPFCLVRYRSCYASGCADVLSTGTCEYGSGEPWQRKVARVEWSLGHLSRVLPRTAARCTSCLREGR